VTPGLFQGSYPASYMLPPISLMAGLETLDIPFEFLFLPLIERCHDLGLYVGGKRHAPFLVLAA